MNVIKLPPFFKTELTCGICGCEGEHEKWTPWFEGPVKESDVGMPICNQCYETLDEELK